MSDKSYENRTINIEEKEIKYGDGRCYGLMKICNYDSAHFILNLKIERRRNEQHLEDDISLSGFYYEE